MVADIDNATYYSSRPYRFVAAVALAVRHKQLNTFPVLHCKRERMLPQPPADASFARFQAAARQPTVRTPDAVGTFCEPWITRGAVTILDQLLEPRHRGLEWSSGSSTVWALPRLASLHTVEHDGRWLTNVTSLISTQYPADIAAQWKSAHSPCVELKKGACGGWAHAADGANDYSAYVSLPRRAFLPELQRKLGDAFSGWDYVLVDGRSRVKCVAEAVRGPGFLAPHGLLVLDNADRNNYLPAMYAVPRGWLKVSFSYRWDTTVAWMRCEGHDPSCARARRELQEVRARYSRQPERSGRDDIRFVLG